MRFFYRFLIVPIICISISSQAQNSQNRMLLGFGAQGADMSFGDAKSNYYKNWALIPAFTQIKMFHYQGKGFSTGWQLSLGQARRNDSIDTKFFLQWGIDIKYSFANGYIFKEKSWFDPYLLVGGGLDKWGDTKGSINVGGGLNIWLSKNVALFGQVQYNYLPHKKISPETADPRPSFMHHSFGLAFRLGKGKDSDKDGIPDVEDKCPNDPGPPETNGCPDTDHDGIIDKDDKCPTVAGVAQFQGCPDTDGDGIPDVDDACPTEKGPIETKGCPDKDNDGIADKDDKCPNEPGPASTMGCPDRDGDGIPDKDDACPDQRGPAIFNGCPDTDGDGIPDNIDKCPEIFGVKENQGCPIPVMDVTERAAVQQKLNFAAKNIFFETGKEVLKGESLDDLDSVVSIMKQYQFLNVTIEGYTDNVGSEKSNLDLSDKRAEAVESYLTTHGIQQTRLTAKGYGPAKPVATNNTSQGRAKNRRVEINIKD